MLSEKDRVTQLLSVGDFSNKEYNDIALLARYLVCELGMCKFEEIVMELDTILKDKLSGYITCLKEKDVERAVKSALKHPTPLRDIKDVYVLQEDIDLVQTLKTKGQRSLMFSIIMYNRFNSIKTQREQEWINQRGQLDVLRSANVHNRTFAQQNILIGELEELGLIEETYPTDNLSFKLLFKEVEEGEIIARLSSLEDLGHWVEDYINLTYNGYKKCECCGKSYKPKSKTKPEKYCGQKCKIKMNIVKTNSKKLN